MTSTDPSTAHRPRPIAKSPAKNESTVAGALLHTALPYTSTYAVAISTMHTTAATAATTRNANGLLFLASVMIRSTITSTKKMPEAATSLTIPEPKFTVPALTEASARGMLWTCVEAAIMPTANKTTITKGTSHGRSPVRVRWKQVSNAYAPAAMPPSNVKRNKDSRPMFPLFP